MGCSAASDISKPSNSLRRIRLTTPATASAPYTEEAPSVMISTLSTRFMGMRLISGCAGAPRTPDDPIRRLFISTRVRSGPRPRSEIFADPTPPIAGDSLALELPAFEFSSPSSCWPFATVERRSISDIVLTPICLADWTSIVCIGAADEYSSRAIRDPVTITSSILSSSSTTCACIVPKKSVPAIKSGHLDNKRFKRTSIIMVVPP